MAARSGLQASPCRVWGCWVPRFGFLILVGKWRESFRTEAASLFIVLTAGLGYKALLLSEQFPSVNNKLHMALS